MSGHTLGPWVALCGDEVANDPSRATVSACDGGVDIYYAPLTNETEANARLIAAAPELLEALRRYIGTSACGECAEQGRTLCVDCQARAAIAKAEGQSNPDKAGVP